MSVSYSGVDSPSVEATGLAIKTYGGLLFWADTLGAAKIVEMLKPLENLGTRTKPTPMLLEMAKTGGKFYAT